MLNLEEISPAMTFENIYFELWYATKRNILKKSRGI